MGCEVWCLKEKREGARCEDGRIGRQGKRRKRQSEKSGLDIPFVDEKSHSEISHQDNSFSG